MAEKYIDKVPQPLNSQFPDRVKKSVAVSQYLQKKEKEATKLHPTGKASKLYLTSQISKSLIPVVGLCIITKRF